MGSEPTGGWRDAVGFLPLIAAQIFVYGGGHGTVDAALSAHGLGALLAIALWLPIVRYRHDD